MVLWSCISCSKPFTRKGDLTRHQLLHTGIKPHVCPTCGKGFAQFSGLKTHLNVHTKAKPYICGIGICKKAFGDPSSCTRHRKETHRPEGAYKCPLLDCGTRIKRRSAFVKHLQKHGIDPHEVDINAIALESASVPEGHSRSHRLPPRIPSQAGHVQERESSMSSSGTDSPLSSCSPLLDPSFNVGSEVSLASQESEEYLNPPSSSYSLSSSTRYPLLEQTRPLASHAMMASHEVFFGGVSENFGHGNDAAFPWADYSFFPSPFDITIVDTSSDKNSTFSRSQTSSPLSSCSSLDVPNSLDHSEFLSGHTSRDFFFFSAP
ncbi:hypothetical protein J3A83DRAFT_4370396 [Scleroderma citrinum]